MRVTPSVAKRLTRLLSAATTLLLAALAIAVLFAMWYATWPERLVMLLLMVPLFRDMWAHRA